MSAQISRDEWLKALGEAGIHDDVDDQDALTILEFAAMFGIDRQAAECRLKKLVKVGKATRTTKRGHRADGRTFSFVAFRLVQ